MAKSHDAYIEIYSKITLHSHVHIKKITLTVTYIHGHHHSPSFTRVHENYPTFPPCPWNKQTNIGQDTSTVWILWMEASTSCSEVTSWLLMASAILVADHWRKASPRLHGRGLEDCWNLLVLGGYWGPEVWIWHWRLLENDWNHWWEKRMVANHGPHFAQELMITNGGPGFPRRVARYLLKSSGNLCRTFRRA